MYKIDYMCYNVNLINMRIKYKFKIKQSRYEVLCSYKPPAIINLFCIKIGTNEFTDKKVLPS